MAGVVRLQGMRWLRSSILTQGVTRRAINTSVKNSEAKSQTECAQPVKENWVSYGFDRNNKTIDRNAMKQTFFWAVTVCLIFGGFGLSYLPDPMLRNWSQREAYLELRRREELGLPPIDRNHIDPAKIVLPSDEELGDTEIII